MNTNHEMTALLRSVTNLLCCALKRFLPSLSQTWWRDLVIAKLSFQQQQHAARRHLSKLDDLDLSVLLRVIDQNWHELADHCKWPYDARNYVKETQTVRNRWAHAGVTDPSTEDVYRDLDTLQRFVSIFAPTDPVIDQIRASKGALLGGSTNSGPEPRHPQPKPTDSKFVVGTVRLRADPTQTIHSDQLLRKITQKLLALAEAFPIDTLLPTVIPEAKPLVATDPYAFAIATCLDRGARAEVIWTIPYDIKNDLGHLDPWQIHKMTLNELAALFARLPRRQVGS